MAANEQKKPSARASGSHESDFSDEKLSEIRLGVGKRLKEAFDHVTNAEIARRIDSTDTTIKAYTDAARMPAPEILLKIHRATGINIHWLLTGDGPRRVEPYRNAMGEETARTISELAVSRGVSFDEMLVELAEAALEISQRFR